jgi:hypothetical protein
LKRKNKHVLIRKFKSTSNKKINHHPTFIDIKKSHQFKSNFQAKPNIILNLAIKPDETTFAT